MKNIFFTLRAPALAGFTLTVPFIGMELINRREFNEDFPFVLFILLWLLPLLIIFILQPTMRKSTVENKLRLSPGFFIRIIISALLAWFWVSLVIDQMPCFLGEENCD